jgi:hypothetical protein
MAQCKKCGKKGLLLRLEKQTGLCLSCKGEFAEKAKPLAEKLMEVENAGLAEQTDDPKTIVAQCEAVEENANKLISLKKEYSLEPGPELSDLVNKYRDIKQKALDRMKG